jgi:hypothetical protein
MEDGKSDWWMSDDVTIPGDQAEVGSNNIVTVTGRKRPGTLPPLVEGGPSPTTARIEVFLCVPSLSILPTATPSTRKIGQVSVTVSALNAAWTALAGSGVSKDLPAFTVPAPSSSPDPNDAFSLGHRCLIARIYPLGFTPSTSAAFNPFAEPHEVQRNIWVVAVRSPGKSDSAGAGQDDAGMTPKKPLGPNKAGLFEFRIDTRARTTKAEDVTLRATWVNAHPEIKRFSAALKPTKVFRGFAETPPAQFGFHFDLPAEAIPHEKGQRPFFPNVLKVSDATKPRKGDPRYDAIVRLQPKKVARIGVTADLRGAARGQAHVFHVEQFDANRKPTGGGTLIFIPVS